MTRFADGKPDKNNYRRYKIKNVSRQDDFAAMHEVVTRRYRRLRDENRLMPDLVMVDGGAGQVSAAYSALKSLGINLQLIGLAKENEEIYLPNEKVPRKFDEKSRMMLLLRQIRDAAHNFAVRYNRKRRQIQMRTQFNKK
jgi:excinuclease ABC subunit C